MAFFYFLKNDGACRYMRREIIGNFSKYLHEPIEYEGKKIKFNVILYWIKTKTRGANIEWMDEIGVNYVQSISDLNDNDGVYITGYDSDIEDVKELKKRKIPIIDHKCPWIGELKNQILSVNTATHQCIIMIDKDHMVYKCYKYIIPEDAIIIQPENYKEILSKQSIVKPVQLIVYAVNRKKDVNDVIEYIDNHFKNPNNIIDGYKKTLCCWANQGCIEEIEESIKNYDLDEMWVICSSEHDRSTMSILNEIKDNGAEYKLIKKEDDIPSQIDKNSRIGVLLAPIPLSKKKRDLVSIIRIRYGSLKEITRTIYDFLGALLLEKESEKIERKIDELFIFFDDNIELELIGRDGVTPFAGIYKGKEKIKDYFRIYKKEVEQIDFNPIKILSDESMTLTIIYEESIAKNTGKKFSFEGIHRWDFNKNKKVIRFKSYNDTYEVQKAFLSENNQDNR